MAISTWRVTEVGGADMAALPLLAVALGALEHIATSSAAFDPLVRASCDAPRPPDRVEASPPTPEALGTATHASRSGSGSVTGVATLDPSLARSCEATFHWGIERHAGSRLLGRVDIGGEGVPAGWAVNFDFGEGANATVRSLVAAELLADGESDVLVKPRLASGYGTIMIDLSLRLPRFTAEVQVATSLRYLL